MNTECKTPNCVRKPYSRGFCKACYNTWAKSADRAKPDLTECECGCGAIVPGRYRSGHDVRNRKLKYDDGLTGQERYAVRLRLAAFEAYGGVCACCGEEAWEFLTIDHINDDGAVHRRELTGSGMDRRRSMGQGFYRWLRDQGYPQGRFQVLCANCNMAKMRKRGCPHQEAKRWG